MRMAALIAGVVVTASGWCAPALARQEPQVFLTDFEQGLQRARREGKPLLVDFWHPW